MGDCCCVNPSRHMTLSVKRGEFRGGLCVPLLDTLEHTVQAAAVCKCVQTYLGDPQTLNVQSITAADKEATRAMCCAHNTTMYVHCSLIANLAKPNAYGAVKHVTQSLDTITGLPAACVLHVGKVGTIENVAQRINDIQRNGHLERSPYSRVPYHLLLEIAAGQGTELGRSWHEIRHLYEALDYTRVGWCIDTQHAFASGMCDFQTHESVVQLFDAAQSFAHKGISMVHLNDSAKPFGSQVDRHAPLTRGHIWSRSTEGLASLINLCKESEIDMVSETSDPLSDLRIMTALSASNTLP